MKAFTDINQSRKLAEILPTESADHHYVRKVTDFMDITERISEFETGKTRREYRIDGKWYKTKKAFEKAMETFEYKKGGEE